METVTEREYAVLLLVDRLRIARAVDIAWLGGYSDFSYCRKGLGKLHKMGLLQITRDAVGANCYYLSGQGLAVIGKKTSHPYEVSYTTNHALLVGRVCSWLKITEGADPNAMLTDAILRANGANQRHRPDIVLGRKAFEVELNHKPLGILMKNIQANDSYGSQVWITPDSRPSIARNLLACAEKVGVEIKVIPLSEIEKQVSAANIHENSSCSESGTDIESVVSIPINSPVDKYAAYLDEL